MTFTIIDDEFIDKIKKLADFAEKNPLSMDDLLDMYNKAIPVAGDTEGYYITDELGTKVVYTIELQEKATVRHLSISANGGRSLPNPIFVEMIMLEIGFKNKLHECIIDFEKIPDIESRQAINILEIIKVNE